MVAEILTLRSRRGATSRRCARTAARFSARRSVGMALSPNTLAHAAGDRAARPGRRPQAKAKATARIRIAIVPSKIGIQTTTMPS